MKKSNYWWLGFKDGIKQPFYLSSGITWEDEWKNLAYDFGVNWGQLVGGLIRFRPSQIQSIKEGYPFFRAPKQVQED